MCSGCRPQGLPKLPWPGYPRHNLWLETPLLRAHLGEALRGGRCVRLLGVVLSNVCSCVHACACMFLQEHGRSMSPQVCVHRCPVCAASLMQPG